MHAACGLYESGSKNAIDVSPVAVEVVAALLGFEEIEDVPVACLQLGEDRPDLSQETSAEDHIILEDQDVLQLMLLRMLEKGPVRQGATVCAPSPEHAFVIWLDCINEFDLIKSYPLELFIHMHPSVGSFRQMNAVGLLKASKDATLPREPMPDGFQVPHQI